MTEIVVNIADASELPIVAVQASADPMMAYWLNLQASLATTPEQALHLFEGWEIAPMVGPPYVKKGLPVVYYLAANSQRF